MVTDWFLDDDFHARLEALFETGRFATNVKLAEFLSEKLDYVIDGSSISNLRRREYSKSRFIGPICGVFGWPRPPVASVDPDAAEMVSNLLEVMGASEADKADMQEYLRLSVEKKRLRDKANRTTPDQESS